MGTLILYCIKELRLPMNFHFFCYVFVYTIHSARTWGGVHGNSASKLAFF